MNLVMMCEKSGSEIEPICGLIHLSVVRKHDNNRLTVCVHVFAVGCMEVIMINVPSSLLLLCCKYVCSWLPLGIYLIIL